MMKHLLLAGGVLGSVALAGCGINGKINATPTGNGTYHVSGTVHTTGPSSTPSSSNPTHSSSSSSTTTSTSNPSGTSSHAGPAGDVPSTSVVTSSSTAPSATLHTTFVPGFGNLPTTQLNGSGISVSVQHVYAVGQLIVNGRVIAPPNAHVESAVIEMTIVPHSNGIILPIPNFWFTTTNAVAAPRHLGQVAYFGAGQHKVWMQYQVPVQGIPPRLVLGSRAYPLWVVAWVERPTTANAHVATLWAGTQNGKPGGVIRDVPVQAIGSFSLRTH